MRATDSDVARAREVLRRYLRPSRLVRSDILSSVTGADVYLKLDSEQPTGSFKVRGALYSLSFRLAQGPVAEVVAASTGNHGAAVAFAARQLSVRARIFVPDGANPVKLARIRGLGAVVVESGPQLVSALDAASDYAAATDAFLLSDVTEAQVPVGAATIVSEIYNDVPQVDGIYVPVGDTALIRGVSLGLRALGKRPRLVGVQADGAPAYFRSWQSGSVVTTERADTIADGLATTLPIAPNVAAIRADVAEMRLVTDEAMIGAIRCLLTEEHLVAEPAGAAPLAALLGEQRDLSAGTVVLLVTGSNVSNDVLERAILGPHWRTVFGLPG